MLSWMSARRFPDTGLRLVPIAYVSRFGRRSADEAAHCNHGTGRARHPYSSSITQPGSAPHGRPSARKCHWTYTGIMLTVQMMISSVEADVRNGSSQRRYHGNTAGAHKRSCCHWARQIGPETTRALRVLFLARLQSLIRRALQVQPATAEAPRERAPQTRDH